MIEPDPGSGTNGGSLEVRSRQLNAVHTICRQMSSSLDLDDRLRDILEISMQAVDAAAGTIYLHRPTDDKLVFRYVVGPAESRALTGTAINASDGIAGAVFRSGIPQVTNHPQDTAGHRRDVGEKIGFLTRSMVTVPLKYQAGRAVGAMQIVNKRSGGFDDHDLEVLEIIGSIAATAIETAQLHREAQLSAVANAIGDLSHDIKNKIAPVSGWVDTLRPMMDSMFTDADVHCSDLEAALLDSMGTVREFYGEAFDTIMEQIHEIQDYCKLIGDAVKGIVTEPQLELRELNPLVEKQVTSLEPVARKRGIEVSRELGDVPVCRFDRFQVERGVMNLIGNAIPETPPGGRITVRTAVNEQGRFPDGSFVAIEVQDTGRGMPQEVLDRILCGDAKSTKPGGTGLGTRIVYNAVAAHKGVFEGSSREGEGTLFRIKLPLVVS